MKSDIEALCEKIDNELENSPHSSSLSALIYNRAVCEGYAKSFKYIADGLRNTNNNCCR